MGHSVTEMQLLQTAGDSGLPQRPHRFPSGAHARNGPYPAHQKVTRPFMRGGRKPVPAKSNSGRKISTCC